MLIGEYFGGNGIEEMELCIENDWDSCNFLAAIFALQGTHLYLKCGNSFVLVRCSFSILSFCYKKLLTILSSILLLLFFLLVLQQCTAIAIKIIGFLFLIQLLFFFYFNFPFFYLSAFLTQFTTIILYMCCVQPRCTPPNKGNDYQKIYSDWCHEFEKYKSAMKTWEKKQAVSNMFHMFFSYSYHIKVFT